MTRYLRILAAALLAATLSACGGSTGPQSSAGTPMIAAASQVSGTVTGLASVVVDGTEYDDSAMVVSKEIDPTNPALATTADLQIGQQVELTSASGVWNHATIRPPVIGPVETVDTVSSTLNVLGQTVLVGSSTTYAGGYTALADVLAGDTAEVHGTLNSDGSIQATRIEKETQTTPKYVVVGTVSNGATGRFTINALTVTYDATTLLRPASATVVDGEVVTVFSATAPGGTSAAPTLAARAIRVHVPGTLAGQTILEDGRARNPVTDVGGNLTGFEIEEFSVDTTSAALAVTTNGAPGTLKDITAGTRVYVLGTVSVSGTLVASQIWVKTAAATELLLVGPITRVDTATQTLTVRHTTVDYSQLLAGQIVNGSAADIVVGAYVVVTGTQGAANVTADSLAFTPVPPDFASRHLPDIDLPLAWRGGSMPPPRNVNLPPKGTRFYAGQVGSVSTDSAGATSFTLTDSRGMSVTVDEATATRYMPAGTSMVDIVNGSRVFILGVLNSTGSVDASLIRLMK